MVVQNNLDMPTQFQSPLPYGYSKNNSVLGWNQDSIIGIIDQTVQKYRLNFCCKVSKWLYAYNKSV